MKNFHIIIQKNKNVIVILSIWLIFYLFIILLDSIIKLNLIQTKKKKVRIWLLRKMKKKVQEFCSHAKQAHWRFESKQTENIIFH